MSEFHRFPQPHQITAVRWLPSPSAFDRYIISAVHSPTTSLSALHLHSLDLTTPTPHLTPLTTHPLPSPATCLRSTPTLLAAATLAGSLHVISLSPDLSVNSHSTLGEKELLHRGPVAGIDLDGEGRECVTVGEDGRVNVVRVGEAVERVSDGKGMVGYTAVRWGSPAEFATGGLGFGLGWWDRRKPGGLVAQLKGDWARGSVTGMVHSIDIQPSRKHICMVGGSSGTILAWDLRWQQQPIVLSSAGLSGASQPVVESEVWEVQFDSHTQSSSIISTGPSSKLSPVMICSEDGILAVLEQDEEPTELLAEPCAINAFDISPQNPSDVVCALEWETIGVLMRQRDAMVKY